MAELWAGAAVGAAFSELLKVLINVIKTTARFKSTFKRLQATLLKISPIFEDIKRLDEVLDRPEEEVDMFTDQLKKGKDLILLCSKIEPWNIFKKYFYSRKLQNFDDLLIRFFHVDVQGHQVRDIKQISMGCSNLSERFETVLPGVYERLDSTDSSYCSYYIRTSSGSSSYSSTYPVSSCVGELPELIIGLDSPLKEVKDMLLKDDKVVVQAKNSSSLPVVVLLSAPPGCGKTTLAKMVCLDFEIIGTFKENIFFVTVSKTVNIKVIVQRVFQQKGCLDELLEVQSDEDAINQLGQLLRKIGGGS